MFSIRTPRANARDDERSRKAKFLFALIGALLAGVAAYAGSNWAVGLHSGSSGAAESAAVADLSIDAVASPAPGNLLFPGADGDVVVTITNPNSFPVTITAVQLPTDTTFAAGYTTSALNSPQAGCAAATPSGVTWKYANASSGSSHTLTTPLTVAANGQAGNPLTVTFANAATMAMSAPAACEDTFFAMPSLTAITASAGAAAPTSSPAVDAWTS